MSRRWLVAGIVVAAAAALPSAAQAADAYWYDDGVKVSGTTSVSASAALFGLDGTLAGSTAGVTCFSSGWSGSVTNGTPGAGSIASLSFGGCAGTGVFAGCPVTMTAQNLPYAMQASYDATARTYAVAISGIDVAVAYGTPCSASFTVRGALTPAYWNTPGPAAIFLSPSAGSLGIYNSGGAQIGSATAETFYLLSNAATTTEITLRPS